MKKVRVFIERGKDGSYGAYMPDDNVLDYGIIGDGATAAEAIADFRQAYEEMRLFYQEEGRPFKEVEFEFSYDVPSMLVYYADLLTYKGLARLTGISASQLSQYISGYRTPSGKTVCKIENALHKFGAELTGLHLLS